MIRVPFLQAQHFGTKDTYNFMIIDLLGPSLEELFNRCNRRFSMKTSTLKISLNDSPPGNDLHLFFPSLSNTISGPDAGACGGSSHKTLDS